MQNTASDHWPQSSLGSRHAVKQRPVTGSAWPTHGVYIMSVCNHSNQLINHPCLCRAPVAQKSSRVQWLIQLGWSLQCVFLFFSSAQAFIFNIEPGIVKPGSIPSSLIQLPDNSMERQMFETLVLVNLQTKVPDWLTVLSRINLTRG